MHKCHCAVGSASLLGAPGGPEVMTSVLLLQRQVVVLLHLLPRCEVSYCLRETLTAAAS